MNEKMQAAIDYLGAAIDKLNAASADVQHACDVLRVMDSGIDPSFHYLNINWIGQNVTEVTTDDFSNSDCGPACLAMWLNFTGRTVTVDDVSRATGQPAGYKYTLPSHLITAAKAYDLKLTRVTQINRDIVRIEINNKRPLIVLVHYGSLITKSSSTFQAGHWLLIVGYSDTEVFYNDPYWQDKRGESISLAWSAFEKAMADCAIDGNTPNQALIEVMA